MTKKLPTRTVELTVHCIVPEHWKDGKVVRLLDRLIRVGEADAGAELDGWEDPDTNDIAQMNVKKPRVSHATKSSPPK